MIPHRHLKLTSDNELTCPEKPVFLFSTYLSCGITFHSVQTRNFGVIHSLTYTVTTFKVFNKFWGVNKDSFLFISPLPVLNWSSKLLCSIYLSFSPSSLAPQCSSFVFSHIVIAIILYLDWLPPFFLSSLSLIILP